jgi:N-acetylglucosamine-6-sulfatase
MQAPFRGTRRPLSRPLIILSVVLGAAASVVLLVLFGAFGADDEGQGNPKAAATGKGPVEPRRDSPRPNVILIMTDDQALSEMRAMPKTKRLLGDRGVTFENFFTSFPLCCPSRATLLTGQYAHNTGVKSDRGYPDFQDQTASPVALKRAGYRTGYIGKYINGYMGVAREDPEVIPAGWSRWFGMLSSRMFNWKATDDGTLVEFGHDPGDYQTDVFARLAQRFVGRSVTVGKPFFLTVATLAPHGEPRRTNKHKWPSPQPAPRDKGDFAHAQVPKPPSYDEARIGDKPPFLRTPRVGRGQARNLRQRERSRLPSLGAVDDMVAKLVRELREIGELDDTYIMFTSDNGYLLGEHRTTGKALLYEESLRVPMLMRGPGIPPGEKREQVTANIDIMPTVHAATAVDPLIRVDGISLLPLARDPAREADRDLLLEAWKKGVISKGIRSPRYMYAQHDVDSNGTPDQFELYDLDRDPYELRNRYRASRGSDANPRLAAAREALEARLRELRRCAGGSGADPCR